MFEPGSVSHGTLRTQDLLRTFADLVEPLNALLANEARGYADCMDNDEPYDEEATDVFGEMMDILNDNAPHGYYFGAHEGDGSDFGFWPIDD